MKRVIALYEFNAEEEGELALKKNNILEVIEDLGDWIKVKNKEGKSGLVPISYIAGPVDDDARIICRGKLRENHKASSDTELSLEVNAQVAILDKDNDYWWYVGHSGKTGYVPAHIIKVFKKTTTDDSKYKVKAMAPQKAQCHENTTVLMAFEKELPVQGKFMAIFKGEYCEKVVETERINDFALRFVSPQYYPAENCKVNITHQKPGHSPETISKNLAFEFESNLDIVDNILRVESDPFNFLCSSLKIEHGDQDTVDHILAGNFEKQIPEGFEMLKSYDSQGGVHPKKMPTLLHFAAYYNLKKLAKAILKCPGASEALHEKNCKGMTPTDMAKSKKNNDLESVLQDHQEADEVDVNDDMYEVMEQIYEKYTSMDDGKGKKGKSDVDEGELYEDMGGNNNNASDEHYVKPRLEEDDKFDDYSDVDDDTETYIDINKPFRGLSEKEVQLALLQKRVKERYITRQQALEMAKLLRLEPEPTTTAPLISPKPKLYQKHSVPHLGELQSVLSAKSMSIPRTCSTSSGSSVSSVSSTGSTGSAGHPVRASFNNNPPPPPPPHRGSSRSPSSEARPHPHPALERKPKPSPRRGR